MRPEAFHTDWGAVVAIILGAVIGVIGTLVVEYFRKDRPRVRFVVTEPEDLANALRSHSSSFEVKINNMSAHTLIAAGVSVQNIGNVVLRDLKFDLIIPGNHSIMQAQALSSSAQLTSAVGIAFQPGAPQTNPVFNISVPFLNREETFKITTFFDEPLQTCVVECRMPGVTVQTLSERDFSVGKNTREKLIYNVARVSVSILFVLVLFGLSDWLAYFIELLKRLFPTAPNPFYIPR